MKKMGLDVWCLRPIFQLYSGSQIYWWRKPNKSQITKRIENDQIYDLL